MSGSKNIFRGELEINLKKPMTPVPAFSFRLKPENYGAKIYQVKVSNYSINVSWKQHEVQIGYMTFIEANYFFTGPIDTCHAFFNYTFQIYPRSFANLSAQFLADVWNIKEDIEFLGLEIMPKIWDYLFVELVPLAGSGYELLHSYGAFILQVDFETDTIYKERKPRIVKIEFLNKKGNEIKIVVPDKIEVDNLIYEIYEKSVFTIDLPVAYSLVYFWAFIVSNVFKKMGDTFAKDMKLVEYDDYI